MTRSRGVHTVELRSNCASTHLRSLTEQLLQQDGWAKGSDGIYAKGGQKLEFSIITNAGNVIRETFIQVAAEQYKQIGINADPKTESFEALVDRLNASKDPKYGDQGGHDYDAGVIGWGLSADPDRVVGVAGHAIPAFWFGLLFILILSVQFRLFPVGGMLTIGTDSFDVPDRLAHLFGPVLTLSFAGIANYSRYMRAETLEVLGQDYVRTARAKGLQENIVLFVHALRNALLPLVTALGTQIAFLISGAIVIEQVFAWPGMGRMTYDAARSKDYPIVMGVVVISSLVLMLSYIARDLAYGLSTRVSKGHRSYGRGCQPVDFASVSICGGADPGQAT